VSLPDAESREFQVYMVDFPDGRGLMRQRLRIPRAGSGTGRVFETLKPFTMTSPFPDWIDPRARQIGEIEGFKAICFLPLIARNHIVGVLQLNRRTPAPFGNEDLEFLMPLANQIAIAVDNASEHRKVTEAKQRLVEQSTYLREEIRTEHDFEEIIGSSIGLRKVL
jgi:formate hydrogenlyase transcriptional activator